VPFLEIRFEWEETNETKLLSRHGVTAAEAEECFFNRPSVRRKEGQYLMLGRTDGGRLLFLVFERKSRGVVRIFSAREMTEGERAAFRRDERGRT